LKLLADVLESLPPADSTAASTPADTKSAADEAKSLRERAETIAAAAAKADEEAATDDEKGLNEQADTKADREPDEEPSPAKPTPAT
jgi:hypothetical protein